MLTRFTLASAAVLVGALAAFGQTAKPAPAAATKPTLVIGSPAPALSIEKWVKGSPVANFEKGKLYVVEFWATWCPPCKTSMPHLSKLQKEYGAKGVTIIGVTAKDPRNSLDDVEAMVKDKGDTMGYTVAWDTERKTYDTFMTAAGQRGIPCAYVIDGTSGKVVYIGHPMYLEVPLDAIAAGKWDLDTAATTTADVAARGNELFSLIGRDSKAMLAKLDAFAAKYPNAVGAFDSFKFGALTEVGDTVAASKLGNKLVDDAIAANDSAALNQIAWSIVDPDAKIEKRDVALALRAAEKGVALTHEKDSAMLDTLARVYFTKGDAKKAIETQQKAVDGATGKFKEQLQKTLDSYQANRAQ